MIKYILTDIEGTTTSIAFVHDVLFPYFIENFESFAQNHYREIAHYIGEIRKIGMSEKGKMLSNSDGVDLIIQWAKADRKETNLKILQGKVWKEGYESGKLKSHVYEDVPAILKIWKDAGIHIGVYSSGSVEAQKLLFTHTEFGDLRPYFSHYFDTYVGAKQEVQSYKNIQAALNTEANDILFLSDIEQELDAAQAAGLRTVQLVRESTVHSKKHTLAKDFYELRVVNGESIITKGSNMNPYGDMNK